MKHLLVSLLVFCVANTSCMAQSATTDVNSAIEYINTMMKKPSWTSGEAATVAQVCHSQQRMITRQQPVLPSKVSREIHNRFLVPSLMSRALHSMTYCKDWLTCAYLYETDDKRMQQAVDIIEGNMKMFVDNYTPKMSKDDVEAYRECLVIMGQIKEDELADVTILDYKQKTVAKMGIKDAVVIPEFAHFITRNEPVIDHKKGRIMVDGEILTFSPKHLVAKIEKMEEGYKVVLTPKKK